jgi:hypothetical protein
METDSLAESAPPALSEQETETLAAWIKQRGGIDTVLGALLSNPLLPEAARVFATRMQALADADAAFDAILKDVGRYLIAMGVLYLHMRGGATLPRLKAMLSLRTYVSAGRARALLHFLCHLGCLTEVPPPARRDPVRYVPTDRFMATWRNHMRAVLEASRIVEPAVWRVLDRLDEPDVFTAFCRNHTEYGFGEIRESHQELAFTQVFLHRFAGSQIFGQLLAAQGAGEAPLPGAVPISVVELAERHGVSGMHVRRLLDAAVGEGLLRYDDTNGIVLEDAGRATARFVYATQMFVFMAAAEKTAREMGSPS